jgi:alginate O-acetyltransferase complex protein AlgI
MLFNSYGFIFIFLPLSFLIYFLLNSKGLYFYSKTFIALASLVFYSWWNIIYLPLLLVSIIFNFTIGIIVSNKTENNYIKKLLLILGIIVNLLSLGYFKYMDFFIENYNLISDSSLPLLKITLPLAISFFTFQQISYLVDSYKGFTKEYKFIDYTIFVTFFPQLIAGPIVHHKEMMPQFEDDKNKTINSKNISMGIFIFSIGLFKKVVIADSFSSYVSNGFDIQEKLNFIEAWITSLSYTFQLYYDFSGYSDMAIGLALLFNIKLPINFNSPYKATNIKDFWKRWHMTLSRFLKDYIYIPLGGNKGKDFTIYTNLLITFLLAGIWHGAGWTFVLWGLLHAIAMIMFRIYSKLNIKLHFVIAWLITFIFLNITWIFFRAKEFNDAIKVLKGLIGLNGFGFSSIIEFKFILLGLFITLLITVFTKNSIEKIKIFKADLKTLLFVSLIFSISIIFLTRVSEFLYFNF